MAIINGVFRLDTGTKKDFVAEIAYRPSTETETDALNELLSKYPTAAGYTGHRVIPEPELSNGQATKNWLWWWKRYYRGTITRNNADGTISVVATFSEP